MLMNFSINDHFSIEDKINLKNIEKNDIVDMENRPKLQDESKNIIANYD